MKIFRQKSLQKLFILIGGIAFLNLSFILAEIKLLSLSTHDPLIENLASNGFDEEKSKDGESSETESSAKEMDLSLVFLAQHVNHLISVAVKNSQHEYEAALGNGFRQIFSPPPEIFSNLS